MKLWQKICVFAVPAVSVLAMACMALFTFGNTASAAGNDNAHDMEYLPGVMATCENAGTMACYHCVDCGHYFMDEGGLVELGADEIILPQLRHGSTEKYAQPYVAPTCAQAGHQKYYVCIHGCNQAFKDVACTQLIADLDSITIAKKAHQAKYVPAVAADCAHDGVMAHYECSECHQTFEDADCQYALGNTKIHGGHQTDDAHYHPYQAATCAASGNLAYYACTTCNQKFADKQCTVAIEYEVELPQLTHVSNNRHVPYKAPTCEKDGTMEYWVCIHGCGQKFTDEMCTEVLTESPVLPKLGHAPVLDKSLANRITAATRTFVDDETVNETSALYYLTCAHENCTAHLGQQPLSGFAKLASSAQNVTHSYALADDNATVIDVLTIAADQFTAKDGQYVNKGIVLKLAGTYHSASQMTIDGGDAVTMPELVSSMTLDVRFDAAPTAGDSQIWQFDWDGDGVYEQIIRIVIA